MSDLTQKVSLGRTGFKVSRLGIGCGSKLPHSKYPYRN